MPPKSQPQPTGGIGRLLAILALLTGLLSSVVFVLEKNLDKFYIFETDHLHDLAKRGIAEHGNNTRGVVEYIVTELSERSASAAHVNLNEEWVFNNAGGAMGAMYIIHASKPPLYPSSYVEEANVNSRYHRVPHHLRHRHWHRGSHGPAHGRRLLPHPDGRADGVRAGRVRA